MMGGVTNVIYGFDSGQLDGVEDPVMLRERERVQPVGELHGHPRAVARSPGVPLFVLSGRSQCKQ